MNLDFTINARLFLLQSHCPYQDTGHAVIAWEALCSACCSIHDAIGHALIAWQPLCSACCSIHEAIGHALIVFQVLG
jgi:hypothetical protein